jgi:hypothetical protein
MKKLKLTGAICFLLSAFLIASCSDDDSQPNSNPAPQTGELALFAIDTAKVVVMSATGANATTIVNKMQNSNSYIGEMSVSPDGSKFAYSNYQRTFNPQTSTTEIRVANLDGTGDHVVFTSPESYLSISSIRFCSDNKIFFVTQTSSPFVRKMHTVNPDGTAHEESGGNYSMIDISNDRKYLLMEAQMPSNNVRIIDRSGDGGAGSVYHTEAFTAVQTAREGTFTSDGKLAVIPYKEGNDMKVRIIDVAAKTATNKTLITGLGSGWLSFHLEMAADSNRGVITLTGSDYIKSKTYVFNLATGEVAAPFENNDENIFDVYAH